MSAPKMAVAGPKPAPELSTSERFLMKLNEFFDLPLTMRSRGVVLLAIVLLVPAFFLPLYHMTLYSNQFPEGLNLYIYAGSLQGGHPQDRDDLKEINTLNHYIGMRALDPADFTEFKWIPLMLGFFVILGLRVVVLGKVQNLVDTFVLFAWFGLFAAWQFYERLYTYGHNLDPKAPVKVEPFMPPIFGSKTMANFEVFNYPGAGSYFMIAFALLLIVAACLSVRKQRGAA
ncbi:MAG: hypothetical protein ACE14L_04490 [Terriglobales bacterium]